MHHTGAHDEIRQTSHITYVSLSRLFATQRNVEHESISNDDKASYENTECRWPLRTNVTLMHRKEMRENRNRSHHVLGETHFES
jgi:hypothetical protein